jgi:hypothetical protein
VSPALNTTTMIFSHVSCCRKPGTAFCLMQHSAEPSLHHELMTPTTYGKQTCGQHPRVTLPLSCDDATLRGQATRPPSPTPPAGTVSCNSARQAQRTLPLSRSWVFPVVVWLRLSSITILLVTMACADERASVMMYGVLLHYCQPSHESPVFSKYRYADCCPRRIRLESLQEGLKKYNMSQNPRPQVCNLV